MHRSASTHTHPYRSSRATRFTISAIHNLRECDSSSAASAASAASRLVARDVASGGFDARRSFDVRFVSSPPSRRHRASSTDLPTSTRNAAGRRARYRAHNPRCTTLDARMDGWMPSSTGDDVDAHPRPTAIDDDGARPRRRRWRANERTNERTNERMTRSTRKYRRKPGLRRQLPRKGVPKGQLRSLTTLLNFSLHTHCNF